jgi:site-specific DNA-methyltransferase (adenine-specific)
VSFDLRLGDCLDPTSGLASLADKSIDVVITDPPYSEHVHSKSRRGLTVTHQPGSNNEISARRDLGFEHITQDQMEAVADQCARLARRWVLVFCDVESSHLWAGALSSTGQLEYIRTLAWIKLGGAPQFTGDRPAVGFEAIVLAHPPRKKKRWNGGGKAGIYSVPTAIDRDRSGDDVRIHTTQKPIVLMEQLIRDFSDQGETILDPFSGSGTTGVAALALERRFLGWEKDSACHTQAAGRIASTRPGKRGFVANSAKNAAQGTLL